jgi:hypothetical protein
VGKHFMSLNNQHVKNEQEFATMHVKGYVIDQVNTNLHTKKKKKVFSICDNFPPFTTMTLTYRL